MIIEMATLSALSVGNTRDYFPSDGRSLVAQRTQLPYTPAESPITTEKYAHIEPRRKQSTKRRTFVDGDDNHSLPVGPHHVRRQHTLPLRQPRPGYTGWRAQTLKP